MDQDGPVAGGAAAHEDDAAEQDHAAGQGASTDEARAVERTGAGQTGATTGATTGGPATVTLAHAEEAVNRAAVRYDKQGDQHYDVVSAFIKSIRGSDVDAAMHYLARMIEAGRTPVHCTAGSSSPRPRTSAWRTPPRCRPPWRPPRPCS